MPLQVRGPVSNRCLPYAFERLLQADPDLRPGPGLLARVPLGQPPFLLPLRRRRSGPTALVRGVPRLYGAVRLPAVVRHRRIPYGFPMRTRGPSPRANRRTSRFPYEVPGRMHRVSDRAGSDRHWRYRAHRCGLPSSPSGSAPGRGSFISRLNTGPTPPPANASPAPLPVHTHDSGLSWFATPSTRRTFTSYTSPVWPAHWRE